MAISAEIHVQIIRHDQQDIGPWLPLEVHGLRHSLDMLVQTLFCQQRICFELVFRQCRCLTGICRKIEEAAILIQFPLRIEGVAREFVHLPAPAWLIMNKHLLPVCFSRILNERHQATSIKGQSCR